MFKEVISQEEKEYRLISERKSVKYLDFDRWKKILSIHNQRIKERKKLSKKTMESDQKLLKENISLFLENRDLILNDSRMFYAPIGTENVIGRLGAVGSIKATLGTMLLWWTENADSSIENEGENYFIYRMHGLAYHFDTYAISIDGKELITEIPRCMDKWYSLSRINKRYVNPNYFRESYSMAQVVEMLKSHE